MGVPSGSSKSAAISESAGRRMTYWVCCPGSMPEEWHHCEKDKTPSKDWDGTVPNTRVRRPCPEETSPSLRSAVIACRMVPRAQSNWRQSSASEGIAAPGGREPFLICLRKCAATIWYCCLRLTGQAPSVNGQVVNLCGQSVENRAFLH